MDLSEIIRVLGRRWLITVPLFLLTVVGAVAGWTLFPTNYTSYAQVTLLPPKDYQSGANTLLPNPFLALSSNSGLNAAADLFQRTLNDAQSHAALQAQGVTETFSAKLADNADGPFIEIDGTGTDPQHLTQSMGVIVTYLENEITNLQLHPPTGSNFQLGITEDALIRSMTYVGVQEPAPQTKSKVEKVALIAVVGVLLTLFSGIITESVSNHRKLVAAGPEGSDDTAYYDEPADDEHDGRGAARDEDYEDDRAAAGYEQRAARHTRRAAADGRRAAAAAPSAPHGYGAEPGRGAETPVPGSYEVSRSRTPTPGYAAPRPAGDAAEEQGEDWNGGWYHRSDRSDDGHSLSGVERGGRN